MPDVRRCRVRGGCSFLTGNLPERRGNTLLTDRIDLLRDAVRRVRRRHPSIGDVQAGEPGDS